MSYEIRWNEPLTSRQRRWLRAWAGRVSKGRAGLLERQRGALVVRQTTEQLAHEFAALTMLILGRSPYSYAIARTAELVALGKAA